MDGVPECSPRQLLLDSRDSPVHPLPVRADIDARTDPEPDMRPTRVRRGRPLQVHHQQLKVQVRVEREAPAKYCERDALRRTTRICRSYTCAYAMKDLWTRSTMSNHFHPADCLFSDPCHSTRGSSLNRAPLAQTSRTVAPNAPWRWWNPFWMHCLNVGSCRRGK